MLYTSITAWPQHLPWAGPGRAHGLWAVCLAAGQNWAWSTGQKQLCRSWSPPPVPEHWAQPVPPFENPLWGTCPSVRPVGVWQHSQKLSGDGRQTAWLDVKSSRKETELDSWSGHGLVSVFLPLLLKFLIMLVWFVSLSSLELASQLVPQCDYHLPFVCSSFLYLERWKNNGRNIEGFFKHFFSKKVSLLMGLLCYTRHL